MRECGKAGQSQAAAQFEDGCTSPSGALEDILSGQFSRGPDVGPVGHVAVAVVFFCDGRVFKQQVGLRGKTEAQPVRSQGEYSLSPATRDLAQGCRVRRNEVHDR